MSEEVSTKMSIEELDMAPVTTLSVLGPYSPLFRFCGVNLSNSNGSRGCFIMSTIVCGAIIIAFIVETVLKSQGEFQPLTLGWIDSNIGMLICVYGVASAIALAMWSKQNFVPLFEEQLTRLRMQRLESNPTKDSWKKLHIGLAVICIYIMFCFSFYAMRDILYTVNAEDSLFTFEGKTLFGLSPILLIWMGFVSCASFCVYLLINENMKSEIDYFNEELLKSSQAQQLTDAETFGSFGKRHIDMMLLVKQTNTGLSKLAAIGGLLAMLGFINCLFAFSKFMKDMNGPHTVFVITSLDLFIAFLVLAVGRPAAVQQSIQQTLSILLEDHSVSASSDPQIMHYYRMFVDRCQNAHQIALGNAIRINQWTMHKIFLIVPNIGCILVIITKLMNPPQ